MRSARFRISIFKSLNFTVEELTDSLKVTVPTRRLDIKIEEDLIEEVGRIYGMDKIEGKLPVLPMQLGKFDKTRRAIKNKLVDLGLNETLTYSLIPQSEVHKFTTDDFEEILSMVISSFDNSMTLWYISFVNIKLSKNDKFVNRRNPLILFVSRGFLLFCVFAHQF